MTQKSIETSRKWLANNREKNKQNCREYYQKMKDSKSPEELKAIFRERSRKYRAKIK